MSQTQKWIRCFKHRVVPDVFMRLIIVWYLYWPAVSWIHWMLVPLSFMHQCKGVQMWANGLPPLAVASTFLFFFTIIIFLHIKVCSGRSRGQEMWSASHAFSRRFIAHVDSKTSLKFCHRAPASRREKVSSNLTWTDLKSCATEIEATIIIMNRAVTHFGLQNFHTIPMIPCETIDLQFYMSAFNFLSVIR